MTIHEIHNLSNSYVTEMLSLELAQITDNNIIKNYHPNFDNYPGNLFKILFDGRYKKSKGKYFVLEKNGKYLGSAGWNEYELDTEIALVLTRAFIPKNNRGNYDIANYILPIMLSETSQYKKVWITVNEYNKAIYNWFVRTADHKRPALFNNWPEIYKKFRPIGKKDIYYTEQYILEYDKES